MFENLIDQGVCDLLRSDIQNSRLPPSMLFYGREAQGKLTCALEVARILSCERTEALWTCDCPSCVLHRALSHPDLLIIGSRDCTSEIRAAGATFLSKPQASTRYLFLRSIRKLTLRFSGQTVNTDDARFARAIPHLSDIEEYLEEIDPSRPIEGDTTKLEKIIKAIIDKCEKLESDSLPESIPVSQIRNASTWSRLVPYGKQKVLIVDNADRMQEGARNAFLKILEEPPEHMVFVLTTSRRGAMLPTILSRVRTYAFVERPDKSLALVVSRVFHDSLRDGENLGDFFNRFLPVDPATIRLAAALFLDYVLRHALDRGKSSPPCLPSILEADVGSNARVEALSGIISLLQKCRPPVIWRLFLSSLTALLQRSIRTGQATAAEIAVYSQWTSLLGESVSAVDTYNITPLATLERLSVAMGDSL